MTDIVEKTHKKLVLLEFTDEVNEFLNVYGEDLKENPDSYLIVSFHPKVKALLGSKDIESKDSFNFCPTKSHQKLISKLEGVTDEIRNQCILKDSNGVERSYTENLIYSLRVLLSHFLYRVEVITNVLESHRITKVITVNPVKIKPARSLWVESSERYFYEIVKQLCEEKQLEHENIPLKIKVKGIFKESVSLFFKYYIKSMLYKVLEFRFDWSKKNIVFPTWGHNLNLVGEELLKDLDESYSVSVVDYPVKSFKELLNTLMFSSKKREISCFPVHTDKKRPLSLRFKNELKVFNINLNKALFNFSYKGVKPTSWLTDKYNKVLEKEIIIKTYYRSVNLEKFFSKHKPAFLLTQYSREMSSVAVELSKKLNIPSMMIPHGTFSLTSNEFALKEWKENALGIVKTDCKYLALQTPLIEKFINEVHVESKPIKTGPLIFGLPAKSKDEVQELRDRYTGKDKLVILHAGTPKSRKSQRLMTYETIDEYIDGIVALINATKEIKDVHVIIRYREIDGLSVEELKSILPKTDSYSIASDGSFVDYLSISDLLVTFSSSTSEEALQNHIPVLLYNKYQRYEHIKGEEFKAGESASLSALYNVNSDEDLNSAIKWIVENHKNIFKNQELFKDYIYTDTEIKPVSILISDN